MLKQSRFHYIDVDGVPAQCEQEVLREVLQVLEACEKYLDCEANNPVHLRLVLVPAVEGAINTAIMEYDGDLWADWCTGNTKKERIPTRVRLGSQEYKNVTTYPWEPIASRIVHDILLRERADG